MLEGYAGALSLPAMCTRLTRRVPVFVLAYGTVASELILPHLIERVRLTQKDAACPVHYDT